MKLWLWSRLLLFLRLELQQSKLFHFVCVDLLSEEEPWTKSSKFVLMPVWTGCCGLSACSCSPLSCPHLVVQVRFMDLCFQRVTLQMLTQSRCKSAYLSTFNAFAKVSVLFCIEGLTIKAGCSARGDYLFTFWGNKLKICVSVIYRASLCLNLKRWEILSNVSHNLNVAVHFYV